MGEDRFSKYRQALMAAQNAGDYERYDRLQAHAGKDDYKMRLEDADRSGDPRAREQLIRAHRAQEDARLRSEDPVAWRRKQDEPRLRAALAAGDMEGFRQINQSRLAEEANDPMARRQKMIRDAELRLAQREQADAAEQSYMNEGRDAALEDVADSRRERLSPPRMSFGGQGAPAPSGDAHVGSASKDRQLIDKLRKNNAPWQ